MGAVYTEATFERCKAFRAKSLAERKAIMTQCRKDGGQWAVNYCICKQKSKVVGIL